MSYDEMLLDDLRWVKALNSLRNKRVPEKYLSVYNLDAIHALQQEVLQRKFVWEIPYICKIPKKNGEFRECFALPIKSRLVMSVIAGIYYDATCWQFDEHCVSYQQGTSVAWIVRSVRNNLQQKDVYGYKVDLSKYFDSVPEDKVLSLLSEISEGSVIDEYLYDFYTDKRLLVNGKMTERFRSLCQGCAMGPILANLYLQDVDYVVSKMCLYYRYSDDILLVGKNADTALHTLTGMLHDLGLTLNPDKVATLNNEFEFLGAKIGSGIRIGSENLQALKQEIKHRCTHQKHTRDGQRRAVKSLQRLFFKEDWAQHSMFVYYAGLVSGYDDFIELDRYCRQCIRAVLTGKNNFTTNLHKTPDEMLVELGWVNLVDMLNLYNTNRDVFFEETHKIGGNHEFT